MTGKSKSRSRLVHPNHSRLAGCDSCHARHIRCVRLDPQNPTCEACQQRQDQCTNLRNGGARYRPRQGRNLDAALAAFGADHAPGDGVVASTSRVSSSPSTTEGDSDILADVISSLTECWVEGRLSLSEQSEALAGMLFDSVLESSTLCKPFVPWRALQRRFALAGRRLSQCDVVTESLVMGVITYGALLSNHPLIVGPGAPGLDQLHALGRHSNLSTWARRRAMFCQSLYDRLVNLATRSGCFRVASAESVSILAMLADLGSHIHGESSFESARPYWALAVAHLQTLADANDCRPRVGLLRYHLVVVDAMRSAHSGRRPLWTDEDVATLAPVGTFSLPTLKELLVSLQTGDLRGVGSQAGSQWICLASVLRTFGHDVSSKLARDQTVSFDAIRRNVQAALDTFGYAVAVRELFASAGGLLGHTPFEEDECLLLTPTAHAQGFVLTAAAHLLVVWRFLRQWRQKRLVLRQMGLATTPAVDLDSSLDGDDEAAVNAVECDLTALLVDGCTVVARALDQARDVAGLEIVCPLSTFSAVQLSLPKWAHLALEIPCAESGGPPNYPRASQIELAHMSVEPYAVRTAELMPRGSFIDALKSQAWLWASRQDEATACRARLRRIEAAARDNEQPSAGTLPYHLTLLGRGMLPSPDASGLSSPVDAPQRSLTGERKMPYFVTPSTAYVPLEDSAPLELHHGLPTPAFTPSAGSSDRTWSGSPADGHAPDARHANGFLAFASSQHQRRDWSRSH